MGQAHLCFTLSFLSDPDAELLVSEVMKTATYDSDMTNASHPLSGFIVMRQGTDCNTGNTLYDITEDYNPNDG